MKENLTNDHYYTKNPTSESRERSFKLELDGQSFNFICDNGVFSKGRLDEGTEILLSTLPPLNGDVLDLGCGWGAVGTIVGKRFPGASVLMTDVNERALELAGKNLKLNGVNNAVTRFSDGFDGIEEKFDFIITNPPIRAGKQVIYKMFDDAISRLKADGALYIVIRKQQGAESALKHLEYARAEVVEKEKGYWVIRCGGNKNE